LDVIKRLFGCVKTRYKGLEKNARHLFVRADQSLRSAQAVVAITRGEVCLK